jgi:hypothetical protein
MRLGQAPELGICATAKVVEKVLRGSGRRILQVMKTEERFSTEADKSRCETGTEHTKIPLNRGWYREANISMMRRWALA